MTFYTVEEIVPRHPAAGVAVRVIHGERMSVAFFAIAPGSGVPEHAHPHEQIGTVLKGEMELTIAGEKQIVVPGGAYHVPSGAIPSGRCLKDPAEVIEMVAPVREDWR
jgi:unsaturated pyranuronate lyase